MRKFLSMVTLLLCLVVSTGFVAYAGTTDSDPLESGVEIVVIDGVEYLINTESTVLQSRINGTFTVTGTKVGAWSEVVDRNNVVDANLRMTLTSFARNMTACDIMITWSGDARSWDAVGLDSTRFATIPWNGGRYRIFVRPVGAGGTLTMRVTDQ